MFPFNLVGRLFRRPKRPDDFSLGQRGEPGIPGAREDVVEGRRLERPPFEAKAARRGQARIWDMRPPGLMKLSKPENQPPSHESPFGGMSGAERRILGSRLDRSLDKNVRVLLDIFHAPRNSDLSCQEFRIKSRSGDVRVAVLYLKGLADEDTIRQHLLKPLVEINHRREVVDLSVRYIKERLLPQSTSGIAYVYAQLASALTEGETVVLVDGEDSAYAADTRGMEHRQVEESPAEAVVRGPHQGFVENYRTNVALVRFYLQTPQLVTERVYVGARSHTAFALMYLEGIVNPKLVDEVRRRISSVRTDVVTEVAVLCRYIADDPLNPYPTALMTERPDKVANMIAEGHIAIIGPSPGAGLVPVTFWSLMESSEDYYIHFIPASFLRVIRWGALFSTVYASALYVAITTFHPEMIPGELLSAIAAAREAVPFPAGFEVLLMEGAFELIREAGIRIPTIIGPTIGIVGAVILGQAAVTASIVSPILVVVIAISGLGSFAIPNYEFGVLLRLLKFVAIGAGSVMGVPGLTMFSLLLVTRLTSMRSFGIPVTAPLIPHWRRGPDTLLKGPLWRMHERPAHTRPLTYRRQPRLSRPQPPGRLKDQGSSQDGDGET